MTHTQPMAGPGPRAAFAVAAAAVAAAAARIWQAHRQAASRRDAERAYVPFDPELHLPPVTLPTRQVP